LVSASTFVFRYSGFAVRAIEALAGVFTLIFFYLFVKKILNRNIALLCLFLLAVSKYHILYSRFGIRVNLILLFESATLYFLAAGLKSKSGRWLPFILAGIAAGLGFYTY